MRDKIKIKNDELQLYLENITKYDRLSGSEGEREALNYIKTELDKDGVIYKTHYYKALISNPKESKLYIETKGLLKQIKSKTRSFSKSTGENEIFGEIEYIHKLDLINSLIEYEIKKNSFSKDLSNKIIISESLSPISILEIQKRGAIGYIQYWEGNEEEIHEGIFNPIWGSPIYYELDYYPNIPIVVINGKDGESILKELKKSKVTASIKTLLEEEITEIPLLEAIIEPDDKESECFVLIGNHIDSWHYGVTDNGTGNALALYLAKYFFENRNNFKIGLKIAWWSGHSNGRYAGSSLYASDKFKDLMSNCLAYVNIDMPGLKGANNYEKISTSPDLFHLALKNIKKITGQEGMIYGPIRGWDQSFQNIGVSQFFIWASTLEDNHIYSTSNSFMSWWWHTEEDLLVYYDSKVLETDAKLYISAISDLLENGINAHRVGELFDYIHKNVSDYSNNTSLFVLNEIAIMLEEIWSKYTLKENSLSDSQKIFIIRLLNQILYVRRESYYQDYAIQENYIPGIEEISRIYPKIIDRKLKQVLNNQLICEKNRIVNILMTIKAIIE